MAHRKWKEAKQLPGTAGPGNMLGCCFISSHFLWDIHPIRPVKPFLKPFLKPKLLHQNRGPDNNLATGRWPEGKIMIRFATLLLIFSKFSSIAAGSEVENFLNDNGHHYVDGFFNHSSDDLRQLMPKNVYFARIHIGDMKAANTKCFGVFFFDQEKDDPLTYLYHITQRRIKMTLLIITRRLEDYDLLDILKKGLSKIEATSFFYILIPSDGSGGFTSWYQIISLKSGSAVNRLTFAENSLRII